MTWLVVTDGELRTKLDTETRPKSIIGSDRDVEVERDSGPLWVRMASGCC